MTDKEEKLDINYQGQERKMGYHYRLYRHQDKGTLWRTPYIYQLDNLDKMNQYKRDHFKMPVTIKENEFVSF
jgi:hypothetical protein